MEKELEPEVIKATQTSLGKYVKRPPLSEKLLKKPPFRFLHDIVTSVLKTNGFFEGLFEEEELVSDNVKDRDSKILFLNKVISVVALTTGKNLTIKPSKIVSGQEPDKTNQLLQNLAYALDNKLSSDEAVKKFKENTKAPQATDVKIKESKPVKKPNDTKKLTSRNSEKLTATKKESVPLNKNEKSKATDFKPKRKDTGPSKNEPQVKKSQNLKSVGKKPSVESIPQQLHTTDVSKPTKQEQNSVVFDNDIKQNEVSEVDDGTNAEKSQEHIAELEFQADQNTVKNDQNIQEKQNGSYTIADNELNSSLSSQDLMEVDNEKIVYSKSNDEPIVNSTEITPELRIETNKEPIVSAKVDQTDETGFVKKNRPALIPKHNSLDSEIKSKESLVRNNSQDNPVIRQTAEIVRPSSVRPSSSRPGAPRLREKIDIVIPDSVNLLLGKVNIITENAQNDEEEASVIIVEQHGVGAGASEDHQDAMQLSSNEHGHLVQQILNSQKELSQVTGKTEIEWQFGSQKAKEASSQEIEQLRFNIQALSRVANPLGKLLDHIQEDVEVMRQELQQWTNVYNEVSKDMLQQKAASEKTLLPLQTRVKQMDMDIEEKRDKINDIKLLINKNTSKIEKLLANGNVQ